jgi:hypothetical protein
MEKDKRLVAAHLEREEEALRALAQRVAAFVHLLAHRGGLPPVLPLQPKTNPAAAAHGARASASASAGSVGGGSSSPSGDGALSPGGRRLSRGLGVAASPRLDPGSPTRLDTRRPSPKAAQPSAKAAAVTRSTSSGTSSGVSKVEAGADLTRRVSSTSTSRGGGSAEAGADLTAAAALLLSGATSITADLTGSTSQTTLPQINKSR